MELISGTRQRRTINGTRQDVSEHPDDFSSSSKNNQTVTCYSCDEQQTNQQIQKCTKQSISSSSSSSSSTSKYIVFHQKFNKVIFITCLLLLISSGLAIDLSDDEDFGDGGSGGSGDGDDDVNNQAPWAPTWEADDDVPDYNSYGTGGGVPDFKEEQPTITPVKLPDDYDDDTIENFGIQPEGNDDDDATFSIESNYNSYDEDGRILGDNTENDDDLMIDTEQEELDDVVNRVEVVETKSGGLKDWPGWIDDFWGEKWFFAALLGGAIVGFLIIVIVIIFICHSVRKKDEGSYIIEKKYNHADDFKYSNGTQTAGNNEYYA